MTEDRPEPENLPPGYPARPDLRQVQEMRERMGKERASRQAQGRNRLTSKFTDRTAQQMRDIGTYTLIPMLMLAGPAVGYGVGWLAEKQFGGEPWVSVVGVLLGLAAGFQQIIILLKKNSPK